MFNTVNRDHTNAIKWERYRSQNLLPMWVADMDIASPAAIQQAISKRVEHPVYGYTHPWESLNQSVVNWCQRQYQWQIEPEWIVWMPGVVPSFNLAIDVFGRQGRVLVQSPNYPPILSAAERNGCKTVTLPVLWQGDRWCWDWQQLEVEMAHPDCHLFLLCNPMNPHGSVLSADELTRLADLARQHQVFICSDEIHCDLILEDVAHTPASSIPELTDCSVTLMAASKTFNVAGLGCSFAIIPNAKLRKRWQDRMEDRLPYPNFIGLIAAETAFTQCDDWHQKLRQHLRHNRNLLADALNQLNGLIYRPQPATFLAWIESSRDDLILDKHFIDAGIMPSEGKFFGNHQAVRLNFGTGTDTINQALELLTTYWQQN
ncbi:MAG: PatB family C-S lyase [Reinekea sp.]|jgi:cysteine-S-conjugate beta-lyase